MLIATHLARRLFQDLWIDALKSRWCPSNERAAQRARQTLLVRELQAVVFGDAEPTEALVAKAYAFLDGKPELDNPLVNC